MALGQKVLTTAKALGDPTRFSIYQYLSTQSQPLTVNKLARHFNLHPNAIRLHLGKLEQATLVASQTARSGNSGGRPRRLYTTSIQPVEILLPYRNFRLLSQLLIGLITEADLGADQIKNFGNSFGRSLAAEKKAESYTQDQITEMVRRQLKSWGLGPVQDSNDSKPATLIVKNCVFKEVAKDSPEIVCSLVHSVLTGLVSELSPAHSCHLLNGIAQGEEECRMQILETNLTT